MTEIHSFTIDIPQEDLDDPRDRLTDPLQAGALAFDVDLDALSENENTAMADIAAWQETRGTSAPRLGGRHFGAAIGRRSIAVGSNSLDPARLKCYLRQGRIMNPSRDSDVDLCPESSSIEKDECASLAEEAILFYSLPEVREIATQDRLRSMLQSIAVGGSYTHTPSELLVGAKLAWRNQPRCVGRYNWQALKVIDARSCVTAKDVAEACWDHLRVSTNRGKVRPMVTVFRPYLAPDCHVRILNQQLIRYAGYESPDGSIVGDPQRVELTRMAMSLGWRGAGSPFDVLPLIISVDGNPPEIFDVPADYVLEVKIRHPRYPWFGELGLRWHANPAVSDMCLEIGGIKYTAAPFTGWYVNPEIGARNLGDTYRYNMLPEIARRMGLDTTRNSTLWRDRALLELNEAVLFSYAEDGVYMVDHHTASAQFLAYVEREEAAGRPVPADWAWINPPMSACTVGTFHRSFASPDSGARPAFYRNT